MPGKYWTEPEDRNLELRRRAGQPWAKIAVALGRSQNACQKRYYQYGARRAVPQAERRGHGNPLRRTSGGLVSYTIGLPVDLRNAVSRAAGAQVESMADWIRSACKMRLHFEARRAERARR